MRKMSRFMKEPQWESDLRFAGEKAGGRALLGAGYSCKRMTNLDWNDYVGFMRVTYLDGMLRLGE